MLNRDDHSSHKSAFAQEAHERITSVCHERCSSGAVIALATAAAMKHYTWDDGKAVLSKARADAIHDVVTFLRACGYRSMPDAQLEDSVGKTYDTIADSVLVRTETIKGFAARRRKEGGDGN